jgi:hypothetical protein
MKWNGKNPAVKIVKGIYETGVKLTKKVTAGYEALIQRLPGLENWFADIIPDAG